MICLARTGLRLGTASHFVASLSAGRHSIHSSSTLLKNYADVSAQRFNELRQDTKNRVLLVDFHADWCGPCKLLGPILESAVEDEALKTKSGLPLDLAKVDTDSSDGFQVGAEYQVRALPTVIAFKDGQPVNKFVGALNELGVRKFLETL